MNRINLAELTLENIGQWPRTVKTAVFAGLSLFILFLVYWLFIQGELTQLEGLCQQEPVLKADFERKQQQLVDLAVYRAQLTRLQQQFSRLLGQLPEQHEMPALLADISSTGVASGLRFELFAPQSEVMHDFYSELPIKISVVGSYFQLARFLSRVAAMPRIVSMHDFNLQRKANRTDELVMNISAKLYRYRRQ